MGSLCGNWAVCCDQFVKITKEIESIDPAWFASAPMSSSCLLIKTFQLETHPQVPCGSIITYLGMWHIFDSHSFLKNVTVGSTNCLEVFIWKRSYLSIFSLLISESIAVMRSFSMWYWDLLWIRVFHNLDKNTWSLHVPFPMLHSLIFVDVHFVN